MKKIIIILILMLAFSGCSVTHQTDNEKITLDWYVNFAWYQEDFDTSLVASTIEEKFNVDINLISPSGDAEKKLSTMISQNQLSDILTIEWNNPEISELIDNDKIYSITELSEANNIELSDYLDETAIEWHSVSNEIYYFPNAYFLPSDYEEDNFQASNQSFLVRKDIYEEIGSPDMTTIDGFVTAIEKVSKLYPEISLIGAHEFTSMGNTSFDEFLQDFLAVPYIEDNEYYDRNTDSEYLEWLNMYRDLYQRGYIEDEIFTDKKIQMEEKIQNAEYFCMIFQRTDFEYQQLYLSENSPEQIYIAVDGPKNSDQDDHILMGTGINGWCNTMISKSCEHPELALEIMTFMLSEEGQKLLYLGVEGITYNEVDGEYILIDEVKSLLENDREQFKQIYGSNDTYWMLEQVRINNKWHEELKDPLRQLEEWTYKYTTYPSGDIRIQGAAYYELKENLDKLWSETLVKLLTAESETEFYNLIEEYKLERQDLGYEYYKIIRTRELRYNLEVLGIDYE